MARWVLLGLFVLLSCGKERVGDAVYDRIVRYEPALDYEQYHALVSDVSEPSYGMDDLLVFLSVYGSCDDGVLPAFGNYFQDIGLGGSRLGNLTRVGGEDMFSPSGVVLVDTLGYSFGWYVNDALAYSYADPKVSDVFLCSGVFSLRLEVVTPMGSVYEREQWAFLGGGDGAITCPCDGCPFFFEVFYEFHPDVDAYFFRVDVSPWDFNGDGCVGMSDLLIFLSLFGS